MSLVATTLQAYPPSTSVERYRSSDPMLPFFRPRRVPPSMQDDRDDFLT